jgi:plastocyanin
MDTKKGLRLLNAFWAATAAGFVLFFESPAITADENFRGVGIECRAEGCFFKQGDADITIKVGDTVVWLPDAGKHQLVADSPAGAFKTTEDDFTRANPQARTFNTATPENHPIEYHCTHHGTMIGKITVK